MLNAGVWPFTFNITEGNEESITTNVVSTAVLGFLLHPILSATAKKYGVNSHITIVSSRLSGEAKFKESLVKEGRIFETLNDKKRADMGDRYQVTKLLESSIIRKIAELSSFESSRVIATVNAPG